MGTSRDHRNLMERGLGVLLLLALLQTGTEGQLCPSFPAPLEGRVDENAAAGTLVLTVPVPDGVTLGPVPSSLFELRGKDIVTTGTLDYETEKSYLLTITCTDAESQKNIRILIIVNNLNDNRPTFAQELYTLSVSELTPANTVLGTYAATDADNMGSLFYTLTSTSDAFTLKSRTEPQLILAKALQYDDIQSAQLTLVVQDSDPPTDTHSATTSISITVQDEDNRPPWFRPCTEINVQGITICPNTGYTGIVNHGEQVSGPLPLQPSAILAVDGDKGINEPVQYALLSGGDGAFAIDQTTGAITMLKAVNEETIIHMTVMASQVTNTFQFATTSLTVSVVAKSDHPPQFGQAAYEGVVEGVGSMAVEAADKTTALKIVATDLDFAASGNINPNIVYTIPGNPDFSIISGFLFMTADAPAGSYNMEVVATDTENLQNATAQLTVEVVEEPTTTAPPTTASTLTPEPTTGDTTVPTTDPDTTGPATDPTSPATDPGTTSPVTDPGTTSPVTDPGTTSPVTDPGTTSPVTDPGTTGPVTDPGTTGPVTDPTGPVTDPTGPVTDPSTNPPSPGTTGPSVEPPVTPTPGDEINPTGGFTSADMAALGATLGVLLFVCIVVITVLAIKLRKGDSNWKKINEASAFRSSLGPSGQKEGVQYTNEAFQHDDNDKDDKGGPPGGGLRNGIVPSGLETDKPQTRSLPRPPSPIPDDEKEVKPILSKDRSKEDGYKAVWFKEDIDPDAKEEVVIIPDSREEDEDEEDDSDDDTKIPKVKFNDADRDSGLGEKLEDSEEERVFTSL